MGCDIHLHVEIKLNNRWRHYSSCQVRRSYHLFAKMGNVRNYESIEPLSDNLGLPNDVCDITQICSDNWGTDGHSHSYLTSGKIEELYQYLDKDDYLLRREIIPHKSFGTLFGCDFSDFFDKEQKLEFPKELEDFRFVFWFDN